MAYADVAGLYSSQTVTTAGNVYTSKNVKAIGNVETTGYLSVTGNVAVTANLVVGADTFIVEPTSGNIVATAGNLTINVREGEQELSYSGRVRDHLTSFPPHYCGMTGHLDDGIHHCRLRKERTRRRPGLCQQRPADERPPFENRRQAAERGARQTGPAPRGKRLVG